MRILGCTGKIANITAPKLFCTIIDPYDRWKNHFTEKTVFSIINNSKGVRRPAVAADTGMMDSLHLEHMNCTNPVQKGIHYEKVFRRV